MWYTPEGDGPMYDAPDSEWESQPGAIKIYGNWNEYAQGQDADGTMFLPDDQFPLQTGGERGVHARRIRERRVYAEPSV